MVVQLAIICRSAAEKNSVRNIRNTLISAELWFFLGISRQPSSSSCKWYLTHGNIVDPDVL